MEAPRLEAPRLAQAAPFWIRLPPARWTSHGSLCVCVVWCVSLRRLSEFRVWSRTHHATFTFKHAKDFPRTSDVHDARGTCEAEGERTALRSPHRSPAQVLGRVARVPVRRVASGVGEACVPFTGFSQRSPPARQILHRSAGTRKRGSRCRGISSQSRETSEISDNTSA